MYIETVCRCVILCGQCYHTDWKIPERWARGLIRYIATDAFVAYCTHTHTHTECLYVLGSQFISSRTFFIDNAAISATDTLMLPEPGGGGGWFSVPCECCGEVVLVQLGPLLAAAPPHPHLLTPSQMFIL